MARILFILKHRDKPYVGEGYSTQLSSGLSNSATFVKDMLVHNGHASKLVQVVDNNCIDREVTQFKPDIVIIEAYWVVPEKFEVLTRLHPKVKWIIRCHSKMAFLAQEGIGVEWSLRYVRYPNVYLSCNALETCREFQHLMRHAHQFDPSIPEKPVIFLPNYYPLPTQRVRPCVRRLTDRVDVSCFGAIRPLKNHLTQAVAAVKFAESNGLALNFHINATRIEGKGDPVLSNLRRMFNQFREHRLIEHGWMDHCDFLEVIKDIDIGLQVSYSETFNIVAADMVAMGVPVVVSNEIEWVNPLFYADPNDSDHIAAVMNRTVFLHKLAPFLNTNLKRLKSYDKLSRHLWMDAIHDLTM